MSYEMPCNAPLGGDLLYGARAIADFLGISPKTASNKLTARLIPAGKERGIWVSSSLENSSGLAGIVQLIGIT